jgi:hypothetical protein
VFNLRRLRPSIRNLPTGEENAMSSPIDAATIAGLRKLDAEATPGPWSMEVTRELKDWENHQGFDEEYDDTLDIYGDAADLTGPTFFADPECPHLCAEDGKLIVAMRNNLPSLLDTIERLNGECETFRTMLDLERADVKRLREAIEHAKVAFHLDSSIQHIPDYLQTLFDTI